MRVKQPHRGNEFGKNLGLLLDLALGRGIRRYLAGNGFTPIAQTGFHFFNLMREGFDQASTCRLDLRGHLEPMIMHLFLYFRRQMNDRRHGF